MDLFPYTDRRTADYPAYYTVTCQNDKIHSSNIFLFSGSFCNILRSCIIRQDNYCQIISELITINNHVHVLVLLNLAVQLIKLISRLPCVVCAIDVPQHYVFVINIFLKDFVSLFPICRMKDIVYSVLLNPCEECLAASLSRRGH